MANIWFVQNGMTGRGEPATQKSLDWCNEKLGLQPSHWRADLKTEFTIEKNTELSPFSDERWVVIEVEATEISDTWKSGFYFSPSIKVGQVKKLLS